LMRLKLLKINGFKNLDNFELNFESNDGITVIIGNNGSGKSNVLEAISAIFADLFSLDNTRRKKVDFSYFLNYEINDIEILVNVVYDNGSVSYNFAKVEYGNQKNLESYEIKDYLPSNIVMIYSGEDIRILKQYYEPFTRKFQKEIRDGQVIPNLPKMLYLNSFFWTISLLSLLKSDLENNIEFVKKILKNNTLSNIKIDFTFNQTLISQQSSFLNIMSLGEDEKSFTLEEFKNIDVLPNEKDLFIQFTGMVGQKNKIKKLRIINDNIDTIYLSEGEKKQILIRAALEILANENTLILFDEPDANIHVANKIQIKELLKEYPNRENIVTTHSPTLTHLFDNNQICMLRNGQIENKNKQEIFTEISDGIWNYQEQNVFLSSSKEIILLVEGKHDKAHIQEAFKRFRSEYESLEFDIFYADGANNLKQLVLGFSTTDFDLEGKKIIAIFDDDNDGRKGRGQQNFQKIQDDIYCLKSNKSFYGILLPKQDNFSGEFTIENMYSSEKYKEALNKAFQKRQSQEEFFKTGINEISKKIKDEAKNLLMNSCKDFIDDDFEHFKKLFDLILEIKGIG